MPEYKQSLRTLPGSLKVVEFFETVQGEGIYIGVPSVFFRTGMCNLECAGCDTKWDEWTETKIEEIAEKVWSYKARHVVFTGGEPTLWQDGLATLAGKLSSHVITVETNGAVPLTNEYLLRRVNLWSFSPKVGSLGHDEKFSHNVVLQNLAKTEGHNQLKYVLDPNIPAHVDSVFAFHDRVDRPEYDLAGNIVNEGMVDSNPVSLVPDDRVFFQPYDRGTLVNIYARQVDFNINGEYNGDLAKLTKLVMERSGSRFRVVPQLHKYIVWR